jgi:hypothetical protein
VYRCSQFYKRSEYFIGTHDEAFPEAMRVHNPNRSSFNIESWDSAQTETSFAEIVAMISQFFIWFRAIAHDYAGRFELRIRVRERQATLDLHAQ